MIRSVIIAKALIKKKIKLNKTYKYSDKFDKFDKHINFTNLKKKYRALSNKIPLPQNLGKSIIKEENNEQNDT